SPTSPIVSSPNLSSFSLNLNENFSGHYTSSERPIGVKKSKLKRSKDEGLSSSTKLFEIENNRLGKMLSESATSKQQDGERLARYIKAKEFRDETKILMKNLETISDPNVRDYLQ
uniref:No apical meristem-associated C-terminal domain-containing protein n=1 Tax=Solanum tuberosum TaxID=4113 RepID=M0ZQE5_SOLTU